MTDATIEHQLFEALMEKSARPVASIRCSPPTHPAPPARPAPPAAFVQCTARLIEYEPRNMAEMTEDRTFFQSPLPEYRQLPTQIPEVHEPVYELREPVCEVEDEVGDEGKYAVEDDYAETAHLGQEEGEKVPRMWKNPDPLVERIGRWQQGVEDESDTRSTVSTSFRRRV